MQQQNQQMANLQKQQQQAPPAQSPAAAQQNAAEIEKLRKELQASNVEKERFQAQLEMLVQELEKRQVHYPAKPSSNDLIYDLKLLVFVILCCHIYNKIRLGLLVCVVFYLFVINLSSMKQIFLSH